MCGHLRDWLRNTTCLGIVWDILQFWLLVNTVYITQQVNYEFWQENGGSQWSTNKISSWKYRFIPFDFTPLAKDPAIVQKKKKNLLALRTGVVKSEGYLTSHSHTAGTTIRLCIRIYVFLFVNHHSILGTLLKKGVVQISLDIWTEKLSQWPRGFLWEGKCNQTAREKCIIIII